MKVWTCVLAAVLAVLLPPAAFQDARAGEEEENNNTPPIIRERYPPPPPHRDYPFPPPNFPPRNPYGPPRAPNFPGNFPRAGDFPGPGEFSRPGRQEFPGDFVKPPGPYEHSVSRYNRIQVPTDNNNNVEESVEVNAETGENRDWRHCYVCSGMYPDRECELYPKYVTKGPGRINCTRDYCTVFVRYTPKKELLTVDDDGKASAVRSLGPNDYEVTSIARECEEASRGNRCVLDGDDMGLTCYDTCTTSLCNDNIRTPSQEDFIQFRKTREEEQSVPESLPPQQEEKPALKPPTFKQMPPSRDFESANKKPRKPDMKSPEMRSPENSDVMMRDQPMRNENEDVMKGKGRREGPPRRERPSKNSNVESGDQGEAGFSKSGAGKVESSFSVLLPVLTLYFYRQS